MNAANRVSNPYYLPAVTGKHQTDNQPRNTVKRIRKSIKKVHELLGCTISI
jgi:hypothetical protein